MMQCCAKGSFYRLKILGNVKVALSMAALHRRCGHYIFVCPVSFFFFFPRLISAVADWMSTILLHMVWP